MSCLLGIYRFQRNKHKLFFPGSRSSHPVSPTSKAYLASGLATGAAFTLTFNAVGIFAWAVDMEFRRATADDYPAIFRLQTANLLANLEPGERDGGFSWLPDSPFRRSIRLRGTLGSSWLRTKALSWGVSAAFGPSSSIAPRP